MIVEIIDIGSGNIKSIQNWIERLDIRTKIISNSLDINSTFLILPGVGSAGPYMDKLKNTSFDIAIKEHIDKGNRLLGICLGFQLMGLSSDEDGGVEGLGLLKGSTKQLSQGRIHNGWEKFKINKDNLDGQSFQSKLKLTRKKNIDGRVYFNHEYGFVNEDKLSFNLPISNNFLEYSSILVNDNIIGMQFHPEKSQITGQELLSIIL